MLIQLMMMATLAADAPAVKQPTAETQSLYWKVTANLRGAEAQVERATRVYQEANAVLRSSQQQIADLKKATSDALKCEIEETPEGLGCKTPPPAPEKKK